MRSFTAGTVIATASDGSAVYVDSITGVCGTAFGADPQESRSEETKIELKTTAANPRFTDFILLLLPLLPDIQFRKGSAPVDSAES